MEKFDIDQLDTKTMRLAVGIWKTGSVSEAAFAEGLSQSTASYRLDRLRNQTGNDVFIRGAAGMEPTVFGKRVVETFVAVLDQLDQLAEAAGFDPASVAQDFTIAATALEIEAVVAPLQRYVLAHAPNCRLIVRSMQTRHMAEALRDDWDVALLSVPPRSGVLKQMLLFNDRLVTFYDPRTRSAPQTLDDFCNAQHAVASFGGTARSGVDVALRRLGRKRSIKLEVSNLEALAPLMKGTPLITTVPGRLGRGLMRDFVPTPCPLDFPVIPFHAVWHVSKDKDPAHRWLRDALRRQVRASAD